MARPRTQLGTWGRISLTPFTFNAERDRWTAVPETGRHSGLKAGRWRARSKIRDLDGKLRDVERWGDTKAEADGKLREALRDRATPTPAEGGLAPDTTIKDATEIWLREIDERDLAQGTRDLYALAARNYVVPLMGALVLREVRPPNVDRMLRTVHRDNGPASAKTARAVLSGILGLAVRHGAIATNPVRQAAKLSSQPAKTGKAAKRRRKAVAPRALTEQERESLLAKLDSSEPATLYDTGDLIRFMLGTGCRVGEAAALRWKDVDLGAGTVEIKATITRSPGRPTQIQERTKTAAGWRSLALPDWLVTVLKERREADRIGPGQEVFPSAQGRLRDPSNTADDLRRTLDPLGFDWVTSHTFRKTVATRLDDAGLSARKIADQLGHARPSLTQDVYMGRRVVTVEAAELL
jgi:integrase